MLPLNISQNLPILGLIMLAVAFIFEIISIVDTPSSDSTSPTAVYSQAVTVPKWHNFAVVCAIIGVALMCSSH